MPKILLVDDDIELAAVVEQLLKDAGWLTEKAHTGSDALQLLKSYKFDLVLLDWNLPDMTGIKICREFRDSGGDTPIMFLTGRNSFLEKELGLDTGADEYITKPFNNRELLARIRAMLRRASRYNVQTLVINGVQLDPRAKRLIAGEKVLQLSSTEFSIIEYLFKNAGTFYTAADLFENLWPSETESTSDVVRVHIKVLRRKLDLLGFGGIIKTVRGAGYIVEQQQ